MQEGGRKAVRRLTAREERLWCDGFEVGCYVHGALDSSSDEKKEQCREKLKVMGINLDGMQNVRID